MADRYPTSDKNTLYIESGYGATVADLLTKIVDHFGDTEYSDLLITSEKIHTRCIGYDLYDGADWDDYIIITRK